MLGAARRLGLMIGVIGGVTALVAALLALVTGNDVARAMSLGLYMIGTMMIVAGFFGGLRGPMRPKDADSGSATAGLFGFGLYAKGMRPATGDERHDALVTTVLFLFLGLSLIALGVVADSRIDLL